MQKHLLHSRCVRPDHDRPGLAAGLDGDTGRGQLTFGDSEHVLNELDDVQLASPHSSLTEERTKPANQFSGPQRIVCNVLEGLPDFRPIGAILLDEALCGLCVAQDRGKRLGKLVRQRPRQLSDDRDTREVRQLNCLLCRFQFRSEPDLILSRPGRVEIECRASSG